MTEAERAAVIRECAQIVADTPVVCHERGVNGRATLDKAVKRVLRQIERTA
jgi:hypothetical protein